MKPLTWSIVIHIHHFESTYKPGSYIIIFLFLIILQPHVDFGLKLLGADLMSIPGLYRVVQVQYLTFYFYISFSQWTGWEWYKALLI
jgi:hypothetical protein